MYSHINLISTHLLCFRKIFESALLLEHISEKEPEHQMSKKGVDQMTRELYPDLPTGLRRPKRRRSQRSSKTRAMLIPNSTGKDVKD